MVGQPGAGPYVKSADVVEALTALRRVAMAEAPAEGPVKRMPDSVRTAIQAFVGAYDRQALQLRAIPLRLLVDVDCFKICENVVFVRMRGSAIGT